MHQKRRHTQRLAATLLMTALCTAVILLAHTEATLGASNPVEAGDVAWSRDYETALKKSAASGKPVFMLFQEVPGCIGCRNFGEVVLREPLLVEAIEELFVPLLIYNNRSGDADEQIRKRYGEPAWSYQTLRFIDHQGKDIIPRLGVVWSVAEVAGAMISALAAAENPIPGYLRLLQREHERQYHAAVALAMACFWTGEHILGGFEGVIATEAGWYDNREVTLVTYHSDMLGLNELVRLAAREKCAQRIYLPRGQTVDRTRFTVKLLDMQNYRRAAPDDQKRHLQSWTAAGAIPHLSPMQATKLNSLDADEHHLAGNYLSPAQLRALGGSAEK